MKRMKFSRSRKWGRKDLFLILGMIFLGAGWFLSVLFQLKFLMYVVPFLMFGLIIYGVYQNLTEVYQNRNCETCGCCDYDLNLVEDSRVIAVCIGCGEKYETDLIRMGNLEFRDRNFEVSENLKD